MRKRNVGIPDVAIVDDNGGLTRLCASSGRRSARRTHSSALDGEFRRRTKAQGSLPSEDVVLLLLFGLLRTGNVSLRKTDGWQEMPKRTTVEI